MGHPDKNINGETPELIGPINFHQMDLIICRYLSTEYSSQTPKNSDLFCNIWKISKTYHIPRHTKKNLYKPKKIEITLCIASDHKIKL